MTPAHLSASAGMPPDAFADAAARRILHTLASGVTWHFRTDFDGTMSDFVVLPDTAVAAPEVLEVYLSLADVPGVDVAVLSARPLSYLAPRIPPPIGLECSLGLETRHDTQVWRSPDIEHWQPRVEACATTLEAAILQAGGRVSRSSGDARDSDAIFLEIKPTSVTPHCSPALSRFPSSPVAAVLAQALEALRSDDLHGLVPTEDGEFVAPLSIDGTIVDKGTVIAALPGPVLYAGDGLNDVPAARATRQRDGLVLVVGRGASAATLGSPAQLAALADVVVPDPRAHAAVIRAIAQQVTAELGS